MLMLTLELDLLLKENIEGSCCLEGITKVAGNDHVHYVDQLDVDSVFVEATVQVVHQSVSKLTLDITDLGHLNATDVVTDCLFALLLEQLFKFVGAKVVEELLAVSLSSCFFTDMECYTDID